MLRSSGDTAGKVLACLNVLIVRCDRALASQRSSDLKLAIVGDTLNAACMIHLMRVASRSPTELREAGEDLVTRVDAVARSIPVIRKELKRLAELLRLKRKRKKKKTKAKKGRKRKRGA